MSDLTPKPQDPSIYNPPVEEVPPAQTLTFPQAIEEAIKGKRITRLSWTSEVSYGCLADGVLSLFIHGGFHGWIINDGDLLATDWVVMQ